MAESQQPLHMLIATSSHPTCPQAELPPSLGGCTQPQAASVPWGQAKYAGRTCPASGNRHHPAKATRTWGIRQGLPLFLLLSSSPPTPAPLGSSAVATEELLPGDEALDPLDPRSGYPDQPHQPVSVGTGLAATLGCPGAASSQAAGECSSTGRSGRSWWQ